MIKKILSISVLLLTLSACSDTDDTTLAPVKVSVKGATISPEVAGPNQPNQVYIDLSSATTTAVVRDSWDLAFYNKEDSFSVGLNGSIYMAAAALNTTDLNAINSNSEQVIALQSKVAVGTFNKESSAYIDHPSGDITKTAIASISDTASENKVYLLNLGYAVSTKTANTGAVEISGAARGWKKIRITKDNNAYVLQYADLDATTYKEARIEKNTTHHFRYFSFNTNATTSVTPEKTTWDINFSVFTNEIPGYGAYGYSDFITTNTLDHVKAYMIDTEKENLSYDNFIPSDVAPEKFDTDQRSIGSSWRKGGGPNSLPALKDHVFYILQDADNNLYKIKFLALTNQAGERGYPSFIYSLLEE